MDCFGAIAEKGDFIGIHQVGEVGIHRDDGDVGYFTLQADFSESGGKRSPVLQRCMRCGAEG